MLLNIPCKQGKLQVLEEGVIQVVAPFNQVVWKLPCNAITGFTSQPGAGLLTVVTIAIHTAQGTQYAEMVTPANFSKLVSLFPNLNASSIAGGREWYKDMRALTHIETYTDRKKMEREIEAAARFGWIPQTTAAQGGGNLSKALVGSALFGSIGLLAGAGKDKITITFIRANPPR